MMSELKTYMAENKRVPIGDLANHFDSDPAAIRGMLELYVRKGRARRIDSGGGDCGGCTKCDLFTFEIYEWLG
ncbi:MAG TPA: FeoC-like transcriptional regulator [Rhodospirillales bacterium]|nr:FeoC-like transcriptional regulator [Rhodospirillales bacterium]|tara:strand:- start:376 stop:594 length:219 start_codon:yes stop_codon:yes gene_type:complete